MAIDGIGKQAVDLQNLMQLLGDTQNKGIDLAKKLIRIAHVDKSLQNEAEGKGQNIDITA
jgi:hypothetical protein